MCIIFSKIFWPVKNQAKRSTQLIDVRTPARWSNLTHPDSLYLAGLGHQLAAPTAVSAIAVVFTRLADSVPDRYLTSHLDSRRFVARYKSAIDRRKPNTTTCTAVWVFAIRLGNAATTHQTAVFVTVEDVVQGVAMSELTTSSTGFEQSSLGETEFLTIQFTPPKS